MSLGLESGNLAVRGRQCLAEVAVPLTVPGRERETLAATQQTIAVLLRARGGHDPRWD